MSYDGKGGGDDVNDEKNGVCRYCFDDGEEETLISPCKCCGDQKYVHLSCLRRWQRMELVNQPAHPLFWTERERYKICSVCKGNFSCPLPTQYELVETFTGSQIGDLIQPHSIIGATTLFDSVCKMYIRKTPFREKMLSHWINSAYLICRINEGQLGKYYINDKKTQCEWASYFTVQAYEKTLPPRSFPDGATLQPVLGRGCLRNVTSYHEVGESILGAELPVLLVCIVRKPKEEELEFSYHTVKLVNLSRPYKDTEEKPCMTENMRKMLGKMYRDKPETRNVCLEHYRGGPRDMNVICHCIVPGANRRGWDVFTCLRDAILHAHEMSAASDGMFCAGQTVRLKDLKSREDLNGTFGILLRPSSSKKSRWMVRLADGSGVNLAEKNLSSVKGRHGRVMIFWGQARWCRAQLLGQISKGQWGITKALAGDIILKHKNRIEHVRSRMVVAPFTSMTEKDIIQAKEEEEAAARELKSV